MKKMKNAMQFSHKPFKLYVHQKFLLVNLPENHIQKGRTAYENVYTTDKYIITYGNVVVTINF